MSGKFYDSLPGNDTLSSLIIAILAFNRLIFVIEQRILIFMP
jgi:hypothetical protein